jgi:hypothetical protein
VGWLLIVDNADDAGALNGAVQRSLPASDALGHVLLTSRVGTEAFGALGIDAPLTLGVLSLGDATRLLAREAGVALDGLEEVERQAAKWLAGDDALAGLPLALLQVWARPLLARTWLSAYSVQIFLYSTAGRQDDQGAEAELRVLSRAL